MIKKILLGLGLLLLLFVLYLLLWPANIEPVSWQPPTAPALEGDFAKNNELAAVERLGIGEAKGPEDVIVDKEGRIYGSFADGKIRRFDAQGNNAEVFANTKGRPLGLAWAPSGALLVADAKQGLLALRPDGSVRELTKSADGIAFRFTNAVTVGSDNMVYFTDASYRFGVNQVMADIFEHGANGRLLKYDPLSDTTTELLGDLQFANGVAFGPSEDYLLVAETGAYRIMRYWLVGPKKGTADVFMDNLPGLPDNINYDGEGVFWVALYTPRNALLDWLANKPWLRKVVHKIPGFLQPKPAHHAFVLGVSPEGEVLYNLQDSAKSAFAPVTSVRRYGQYLYLGSLTQPAIGRVAMPEKGF